jgi:hypothetical protein
MQIVDNASAKAIESVLERLGCGVTTQHGQQLLGAIRSDGWRSYDRAATNKSLMLYKVVLRDPKAAGKLLPWVYRIIPNAKAVIRGRRRGVSEKHLQSYLPKIYYRFNRCFWERELFDRLVQACGSTETVTNPELSDGGQMVMS